MKKIIPTVANCVFRTQGLGEVLQIPVPDNAREGASDDAGPFLPPHRSGRTAAEAFADLVDASYDLYRFDLYKQLRWPFPETPKDERAAGRLICEYLWRGTLPPNGFRFDP